MKNFVLLAGIFWVMPIAFFYYNDVSANNNIYESSITNNLSVDSFKSQVLKLFNTIKFDHIDSNHKYFYSGIIFYQPTAYFFENFNKVLDSSDVLLGKEHILTKELTLVFEQLDLLFNKRETSKDVRIFLDSSIKSHVQYIKDLIEKI